MRVVPPPPHLAPFVREFMLVEVEDAVTRVRLPELGLVLGVRYRGSAALVTSDDAAPATRLPDATLTGMTTVARRMHTAAGSGVALVRFHAGAAGLFFPALHELFGATVPLGDLLSPTIADRLESQVRDAKNDRQRLASLETLLTSTLRARPADPVVTAALRALEAAHGVVAIQTLAKRLGISQDPFEKRFRRLVGASPKQFASLLRLRRAIAAYRPGTTFTQLALDAGYFDQSHFNRELRAATGQSPTDFFRDASSG